MVFRNNAVKGFDIKELFTNHYVGNYIPVTMTLHAVSWLLFSGNDWGHHLINILFHLINGVMIYNIGNRLFKNATVATAGAIIFLLHPIQVESVGWISELKNLFSTTFYLAAVIQYLRFHETRNKRYYLLTLLFFILGCLGKSSVVILPLTLICIDLFIAEKFSAKFFINKIPFFLLSIGFGLINIYTQSADQFINYSHQFPYYQRIGFAGFALLKYALLFLLPFNLSVIYPYPDNNYAVIVGYATLLVISTIIFFLYKKNSIQLIAIILFVLANLLLVLQFLPFGEVLYADRYLYVPLTGLAWIAGYFISKIKSGTTIVFAVVIVFLSLFTFSRIRVWKNAITLYEDIITKYPKQFIALNSAGVEKMFMNDDSKALEYFNRAISAAPRNYKGYYNRGLLYLKNQKPAPAIKSFNEALALYDYPKALTGRASAYYMLGDIPKAMNDARHAVEKDKNNARAHFVLGNCYNDLNKIEESLMAYNECIRLNPNEADFYFKRAIVFGKNQDYPSCLS